MSNVVYNEQNTIHGEESKDLYEIIVLLIKSDK